MNMKERYRLFLRRKSVYYAFDNTTKSFASLKTRDKADAQRMLVALNDAGKQPALNLSVSHAVRVFQRSRRERTLGAMRTSLLAAALTLTTATAQAQGLVTQKILSLGLAKTIAEAALAECKTKGFATSVAVVDRAGQLLVLLRDEAASAQMAEMARRKAYTARMFRTSTMEFQKRTAFALLWSLALHDKLASDAPFVEGLKLIERAATDDRNFVKKAVNMALKAIARRPALRARALAVATRLASATDPTARWIGKDALRDISK